MREGKQRRPVANFESIDAGERIRWALGEVLIKGEVTPMKYSERGLPPLWPSWKGWAAVYASVREEYLAWYHQRHGQDEVPGAELLCAAYQRGENPAEVQVTLPADRRYLLAVRR